jgi:putative transposase
VVIGCLHALRPSTADALGTENLTTVKVDSAWSLRYRSSADSWAECTLEDAGGIGFERCRQVRERHVFHGPGSKRGWYYFATTQQMKWCESRFEMRILRLLDHDPTVVAVAVQPFVLHYRDDAGRASHTPDVFVRYRNETGGVADARPERFAEKAEFVRQRAATEVACAAAGWSYAVCSTIDPVFEANLDWLASCRHRLVDPLSCADEVLAACLEPQRLGDVVAAFPPAALTRPVVTHLLWASRLVTDLSILLSDDSLVSVCQASADAS